MVVGIAFCSRWNDERCYRCGFGDVFQYDNGIIMTTRIVIKKVWKYFRYCASMGLACVAIGCIGRMLEMGALCYPKQYQFQ